MHVAGVLPQTAHDAECVLQRLIQIRYTDYSVQGCQEIRDFEVGVVLLSGNCTFGKLMRPQATAAGDTGIRYEKQPCKGKPRTLVSRQVVF